MLNKRRALHTTIQEILLQKDIPLDLSPAQHEAADRISAFIDDPSSDQLFQLFGYAGSGKTTILDLIADRYPQAKLCAYTGKAASVLSAKTGKEATTIHRLFYRLIEKKIDPQTKKRVLVFEKLRRNLEGEVILLNECSMINGEMATDLLRSGAKIVAVGDPAQLPPVVGRPAFDRADVMLKEVHRQASESGILRQATKVRTSSLYKNDGEEFSIARRLTDDMLDAADMILCWKNTTRHQANYRLRQIKGFAGHPKAGEPVMCLKNNPMYGVFNGAVYRLAEDVLPNHRDITIIDLDGDTMSIPQAAWIEPNEDMHKYDSEIPTGFQFGYAMTVHKSQGSEWNNVCLFDECRGDIRRPWLYTAITRASARIIVQQSY